MSKFVAGVTVYPREIHILWSKIDTLTTGEWSAIFDSFVCRLRAFDYGDSSDMEKIHSNKDV